MPFVGYERLRATNVTGTMRVLELASRHVLKVMHMPATSACSMDMLDSNCLVREDTDLGDIHLMPQSLLCNFDNGKSNLQKPFFTSNHSIRLAAHD